MQFTEKVFHNKKIVYTFAVFINKLKKMGKRSFRVPIFGIIVILAGFLYLLFNIGALPAIWKPVILSWQTLLIILGLSGLFHRNYFVGFTMAVFGVVFILPKAANAAGFYYSSATMNNIIWPLVIILIGLAIVLHRNHRCCHKEHTFHHGHKTMIKEGIVDYNLIMNGLDEIYLGPEFKGGEINTVMGGLKLDLRKTALPVGDTTLKINSVMGGVTLLISEDWPVEIHDRSLLGNFSDKRPSNGSYVDRRLIIEADLLMGGGVIEC